LEENNITIQTMDCKPITFSIPAMPFDTYASVTGTFTDWTEHKMMKSYVEFVFYLFVLFKFLVMENIKHIFKSPLVVIIIEY